MNKKIFENCYIGINKELADGLGVNEAIVLQQIHCWLVNNEKKGLNYKNGRYWTFNSLKKWREDHFSFWSESTLKRIFASLEDKEILIVGNFNRSKLDRTKWYSIDYDKVYEILGIEDEVSDLKCNRDVNNLKCNRDVNNLKCNRDVNNLNCGDSICNEANSYNDSNHFVKSNECNCPEGKDELCQFDINNTNKNKNNTSIIIQQQQKQGCVAKKTNNVKFNGMNGRKFNEVKDINFDEVKDIKFKEDVKAMLKKFLESAYTEGYSDKIINVLKDLGKDSAYLHDKIEMAKMRKLNSKCGFLLEALKNDYRDSACKGVSKNKFVDFGMAVHKYTKEELDEKIRKKQEKWWR